MALPSAGRTLLNDDEAVSLTEREEALSPGESASLLDWARRTPLTYGPWRAWKKVLKANDTRAIAGRPFDSELLAAMLWRIDTFVPAGSLHTWQKVADAAPWRTYGSIIEAETGTHRFRIARNSAAGYRVWEVRVSPLSTPKPGGAVFSRGRNEDDTVVPGEETWRFEGHEYVNQFKSPKIQNSVLSFEGQYQGSYKVDISDLSFLHIVGDGPSKATWGYLKRRARRLMRTLAARRPEVFWQVLEAYSRASADAGTASGTEQKPLSLAWSWLADDLFLGRSPRLTQSRHGRGEVRLEGHFFWRRARLERAPEIWDAHIEQARPLMLDARALPEAGAVAFNVLRSRGEAEAALLGAMSQGVLERWAQGQVAWARSTALDELARRWGQGQGGEAPSGEAAAKLLIEAGARTRRRVQVLVARALEGAGGQWKAKFAAALQKYLDAAPQAEGVALDPARWSRRARTAARAMFDLVRESINDAGFWKYLPLWARFAHEAEATGDRAGFNWLDVRVREAASSGKLARLADIARLGEAERARLASAFIESAAGAKIENGVAQSLLTGHDGATTRLAWRLIEATGAGPSFLRTLFKALQERYVTDDIGLALYGDEATRLWASCDWSDKDLQAWIEGADSNGYGSWRSPWVRVLPYASGQFFLNVLQALSDRLGASRGGANTFRARYGLRGILVLPESSQDTVVQALTQATWRFEPTQEDLNAFLYPSYYARPKSYSGAWRVLAQTQLAPELLRANWQILFALPIEASAAAAAIELWQRAGIEEADVSPWLQSKDLASFAPDFLAFLLRRQPALLFESLARAGEEQVTALQVLVREIVADDARRAGFWEGLFPRLRDDAMRPVIEARLLSDAQIFGSFARLGTGVAADFFAKGRDEAEALLLSWLDANEGSLERDDLTLLNAAISPLPAVHERGLARIEALGLTLPLALRLWESLLPPAIETARRFAESRQAGSEEEAEAALALCDSSSPQVQAAGREFVAARAQRLLSTEMLQKLTEGTNPAMQAWVAGLLNERLSPTAEATADKTDTAEVALEPREFDRVVLRERRRGREAREKVKQRLGRAQEASLEPGVLLEMARGRVARDREWALQQIARLQAAGVEVAGVEVLEPR